VSLDQLAGIIGDDNMTDMQALLKDSVQPVTDQGALRIRVYVRDIITKEPMYTGYIKRALLAKLMHENRIISVKGRFTIEV
jgi:hypothetical protein